MSDTKRILIDAATHILANRGYHGLTFVEVSNQVGLTRGAVHHHFESQEELLVGVVQSIGQSIRDTVVKGITAIGEGVDVYRLGIDFVWQQMQTEAFRALLQLRTAISTEAALQGKVADEVSKVHEWWYAQGDMLVARGNPPGDPVTTRIIFSALTGAAMIDQAIGAPADDPDRGIFRARLKDIVSQTV
jgi:AcrR family transcriptional regulator